MSTQALPIRIQRRGLAGVALVALLVASLTLGVALVRSSVGSTERRVDEPPTAVDVLGPQRIFVIGSNDPGLARARAYMYCDHTKEEGSRYGLPACRS